MQARDRETALGELRLTARFDDDGIDDDSGRVVVVENEEAFLHPDLRSCKPDPWRVVHRDEHVLNEPSECTIDVCDLRSALGEHGVTDDADRVRSHATRVAS
ncbi:unannotated protein [freshwater metagenome]|uniref:Unannotated protein n=1 Tax=freshwater metagenome TaxID=449393 RepID=A0A6J6JGK3_9ZZZZ